jgi:phosphoenolpyruvate-protein kinase (PTS system EI component)
LFALDEISELADFVSIGTNDLTQFMLAADRNAAELTDGYSVLHPAVLRAVRSVVDASRTAGCELSVCGEAAGDPKTACLLAGLGVHHLSVSPLRAARVRYALRCSVSEKLENLAHQCLQSDSPHAVRELLGKLSQTWDELLSGSSRDSVKVAWRDSSKYLGR